MKTDWETEFEKEFGNIFVTDNHKRDVKMFIHYVRNLARYEEREEMTSGYAYTNDLNMPKSQQIEYTKPIITWSSTMPNNKCFSVSPDGTLTTYDHNGKEAVVIKPKAK